MAIVAVIVTVLVVEPVVTVTVPASASLLGEDGTSIKPAGDGHSGDATDALGVTPSASSPGNVSWSLCLANGDVLTGNALCPSGPSPEAVAYDLANGYLYVSDSYYNNVSVINGGTNSIVASIAVGEWPVGVAYDDGNGYLYVANEQSNNVTVINGATDSVVTSIAVGTAPLGLAYDRMNGYLYVVNLESNDVSVINGETNSVVTSIAMEEGPDAVAYDGANGYLYVANGIPEIVSVISGATNSVIRTIGVGRSDDGKGPDGVAYDEASGYLYVINSDCFGDGCLQGNVTVINGTTDAVVASIAVGSGPDGVTYDGENGFLYVADGASDNISVINGATESIVTSIAGESGPDGLVYDPENGYLYVANAYSGSVSIVTSGPAIPTYSVSFSEIGLSAGKSWSVTFAGETNYPDVDSGNISLYDTNGTYSFSVGVVPGYSASPSSGVIKVDGTAVSISIAFTKVTNEFLGLPGYDGFIAIGVVVPVVVVVVAMMILRKRKRVRPTPSPLPQSQRLKPYG